MKLKLYHGSNHIIEKFAIQNEPTGAQQEGPGIYITTDFDDASSYGRYIYEVEWNYTANKLLSNKSITPKGLEAYRYGFTRLIKKAVDWQHSAQNWDENPERGLYKAIDAIIQYNSSLLDAYQQIWYDFYNDEGKAFCENIQWDGFILERAMGVKHIIAFKENNIRILDIKDKKTDQLDVTAIEETFRNK